MRRQRVVERRETPAMRVLRKFWEKVDLRGADECWLWIGTTSDNGYGHLFDGEIVYAHRFAVCVSGRDPWGYDVHHLCENKLCVNPAHLEMMRREDHQRLHKSVLATRGCKRHGHEDMRLGRSGKTQGRWYCGVCNRESARKARERKHAHEAMEGES